MNFDIVQWDRLTTDPTGLWYASEKIWPVIEGLFVNPPEKLTEEERTLKQQVINYFASRLTNNQVVLGNAPEFFNDDDRWTPDGGWVVPLDLVVVHHTATREELTYEELNALQLLRLYAPLYKNSKAFQRDGQLQPISSGHFYQDAQTFVGYHWIVNGEDAVQLLDDRYTGFHAGHYPTNCGSVGISVVGNLTNKIPSPRTINLIKGIISRYPDVTNVIGHKEVPGRENVVCPGNKWHLWKPLLMV